MDAPAPSEEAHDPAMAAGEGKDSTIEQLLMEEQGT